MSDTQKTSANAAPTTKDLKRVLGFGDLMGMAIGYIIGAGIMSLMGVSIGMTGRSTIFAFPLAALMIMMVFVPTIIVCGTIRVRGGTYTSSVLLGGKYVGGVVTLLALIMNLSVAMYGLSFADYFLRFFPQIPRQLVAAGVITLFYVLNMLGIDKTAKVQNWIVGIMCVSLGLFAAFGVNKVQPGFFGEGFMSNGVLGFLQAAALLTWATGGAQVIVALSGEAKNPTRDIPLVYFSSSILVAVLYAVIALVAGGVLPLEQVAFQPLTQVAETILPKPIFVFFMVGGAMFALATTLNAQFASMTKPVLQMSADGWMPKQMAYLHPKFKTPWVWLTVFYIIGILCIFTGLDIGGMASALLFVSQIMLVIINVLVVRLPKVLPEAWAKSKFKVSIPALWIIMILSVIFGIVQVWLLVSYMTPTLILINGGFVVLVFLFCLWRIKTGQVNIEVSYEYE
ncbi:MAG: APC family permease [Treponema sp.]|jgi:APA family basic amino acid/polyamine antiporter|nr:APC family permease [Treponema sp.]